MAVSTTPPTSSSSRAQLPRKRSTPDQLYARQARPATTRLRRRLRRTPALGGRGGRAREPLRPTLHDRQGPDPTPQPGTGPEEVPARRRRAAALAAPAAAQAHVTLQPNEAPVGRLRPPRCPRARTSATTPPHDQDARSSSPRASPTPPTSPCPGWKINVKKKAKLPKPVKTDDGEITEGVKRITWTQRRNRHPAGAFQDFGLSVRLPASRRRAHVQGAADLQQRRACPARIRPRGHRTSRRRKVKLTAGSDGSSTPPPRPPRPPRRPRTAVTAAARMGSRSRRWPSVGSGCWPE